MKALTEIENNTANAWLEAGTIHITDTGEENTYYTCEFGLNYYCKNYPTQPHEEDIEEIHRLLKGLAPCRTYVPKNIR